MPNSLIRVLIVEKKRSKDVVLKELNDLGQIVPEVGFYSFLCQCLYILVLFNPKQSFNVLNFWNYHIECQYGRVC